MRTTVFLIVSFHFLISVAVGQDFAQTPDGIEQNRKGGDSSEIVFDAQFYRTMYPDVRDAERRGETTAERHWLQGGIPEGRVSSPIFDVKYYVEKNPAIVAGLNPKDARYYYVAVSHWVLNGSKELFRDSSRFFNCTWYLDNNPDVKAAFEKSRDSSNSSSLSSAYFARMHFTRSGLAEKRQANETGRLLWQCYRPTGPTGIMGDELDTMASIQVPVALKPGQRLTLSPTFGSVIEQSISVYDVNTKQRLWVFTNKYPVLSQDWIIDNHEATPVLLAVISHHRKQVDWSVSYFRIDHSTAEDTQVGFEDGASDKFTDAMMHIKIDACPSIP